MNRRLAVLASAVLLFACKPSSKPTKPPAMSPAVDVSAVIVGGESSPGQPVEDDEGEIAVGFDGTSYLVVWTQPGGVTLTDIWAARMTASGELIGSPFPVSTALGNQQTPALAFDGANWLVVFQDHRAGQYLNIYGARVKADGTVLDPGGIPIATQTDHQAAPAVAFDGNGFLVAWADRRSLRWDIYAARVARDGTVQDLDGFVISTALNQQKGPTIAFDGTNYLVVWEDARLVGGYDIRAARVTPAGAVLDGEGIVVAGAALGQSSPAVAFDGQNYVVAWEDLRSGVPRVYAARVSTAGALLDAGGIPVTPAASAGSHPAVAFDGAYALVAWLDEGLEHAIVYGARLDPSGAVLDPAAFQIASGIEGESLAVASDGAGRALVSYGAEDRLRSRVLTDWAPLSVAKAGRGAGVVTSTPDGIDCGETCSYRFDAPTEVSLAAAPDADSVFGGWSGACEGTAACTVTTDAAKSVTARFLALYPVTVSLGSAITGTVTSQPAGIQCGSACSSRFPEGTTVELTATGTPGYSVFSAWTGDCLPAVQIEDPAAKSKCAVLVDGPAALTATFLRAHTVTLNTLGTGMGTVALGATSCSSGTTCKVDIAAGTDATVTATPSVGSVFKSWQGCLADPATPRACTATITGARTVTARFEPSTITLTAGSTGTGSGTVSGAGLACTTGSTAGCTAAVPNPPDSYDYTTVTLTATASTGSVFKSWAGCTPDPIAPNQCTTTMNAARSVSARFESSTIPLTAVTSGTGSGSVTGAGLACTTGSTAGCTAAVPNPPDSYSYTTVTLTATPAPGSVFKVWTACSVVAENPNTCTVTVNSARTVTAKFEPDRVPLTAVTSGTGAGTVTGAGLACTTGSTAGCSAMVENPSYTTAYATVTLTATPSAGSVFKAWVGCTPIEGAPDTCTTTAFPNKSVTARFEPSGIPLTAGTSGTGGGTVTGAGLSCTTGSTQGCTALVANPNNSGSYETVTLYATGDASSVFKSWTGCAAIPDTNSCTVSMNTARTVTAKFEPNTVPLTAATMGTGTGTITGVAGLACTSGSTTGCVGAAPNPVNTPSYAIVTLTATPAAGSVFKQWTSCTPVEGAPDTCTVTASPGRTVSARFEPSTIPLTASTTGTGAGTITGGGLDCSTGSSDGCTALVNNPGNSSAYELVTLTAVGASGSVFKSWSGCAPIVGTNTCTVTVNAAKSVSAKFEPNTIPLTASTTGTGAGTITGAGLACTTGSSDGCTTLVNNPVDMVSYETVTLFAVGAPGSVFKSWSGCAPVPETNTCTVTVSGAKSVSARFEPSTIPLTASTIGTGAGTITGAGLSCTTGSSDGCSAAVNNPVNTSGYETVTLTAVGAPGSVFKSWIGCAQVPGTNTCTVWVNAAKSVSARFEPSTIPLGIVTAGTGAGTVSGPGLACTTGSSDGCATAIENPANTTSYSYVTLTAAASPGSVFKFWSNCAPNADPPQSCTVLVNQAKTVTATFALP